MILKGKGKNMKKRTLIVGGVAAGATCAARLRRLDEEMEIVIFEKGEYVSFANCGLPYHIGGIIEDRDDLLVTTKEVLYKKYRIIVKNRTEVISVDTEKKRISVKDENSNIKEEMYDYLVLSPGASPMRPDIPGIESEKIMSLRNIEDMDRIKDMADTGKKSVLIVGGGFIGIETAENIKERGLEVTLAEAAPHILAPLDTEISMICENEMRNNGVELILGDGVSSFEESGDKITTTLKSGKEITSDFIVMAIGVKPDTAFLKDSGVKLTDKGYITVNEYMETGNEGVFAGGDAVMIKNSVTGKDQPFALAGPANRQGRLIADNIEGMKKKYIGSQGTFIIKIFDLTAASTGLNERNAQSEGIEITSAVVAPVNHASYYPGSERMTLKVIADKTGRIIGSQAVGKDGVDKITDVIATLIHFKGTYSDLAELDLAYAPPYNSAKSPANVAGFVLENEFAGLVRSSSFSDYEDKFDEDKDVVLDVREKEETDEGTIDDSINIPLGDLRDRAGEIPEDKRIWTLCQQGLRGYLGARILNSMGRETVNLKGGYRLPLMGDTKGEKGIRIRKK